MKAITSFRQQANIPLPPCLVMVPKNEICSGEGFLIVVDVFTSIAKNCPFFKPMISDVPL